ncbi:MAG: S8 family serine peptidase, partial [Bacillota bacterium]|nr:S8 family serine peptidase [Bacillota bacterium]
SRGPEVDVAAPGEEILSTYPGGGYKKMSGTSMAAPHVAGVLTLLLSAYPQNSPQWARSRLLESVHPLPGLSREEQGAGLVDARQALQAGEKVRIPKKGEKEEREVS